MLVTNKSLSTFKKILILCSILVLITVSFLIPYNSSNIFTSQPTIEILTNHDEYKINDIVFLSVSHYNVEDKGMLIVLTPSNEVFSTHYFSQSVGVTPKQFKLDQDYTSECNCDMRGVWSIKYTPFSGTHHVTKNFLVV